MQKKPRGVQYVPVGDRYFGERVMSAMGPAFTNRWVIDQVMDIQGPEAYEKFKKAMLELFS